MDKLTEHIPFLCAVGTARSSSEGKVRLDLGRILESAIIGIVLAIVLGWAFKPVIASIQEDIAELKQQVGKIYDDVYSVGGK
jgi:hypothetical protein